MSPLRHNTLYTNTLKTTVNLYSSDIHVCCPPCANDPSWPYHLCEVFFSDSILIKRKYHAHRCRGT